MISIVMTTYNGAKYISEQLASLINQTLAFDELIIVDDGSTDETYQIIENFKNEHPSIKISNVKNKNNLGYKANFKKALSLAKGEYIFLCDQDDVWHPTKIAEMIEVMDKKKAMLLACSFDLIDAEDKKINHTCNEKASNHNIIKFPVVKNDIVEIDLPYLLKQNFSQGCTMLVRKEIVDEYLKNTSCLLPHDWELAIISACKGKVFFYNKPLIDYRLHSNNTIGLDSVLGNKLQQSSKERVKHRLKYLNEEADAGKVASKYSSDSLVVNFNSYMNFRMEMIKKHRPFHLFKECVFGKYREFNHLSALGGDLCSMFFKRRELEDI